MRRGRAPVLLVGLLLVVGSAASPAAAQSGGPHVSGVVADPASSSTDTQNNVRIGGSVYTFDLESDGNYHLRGYACNKKGSPSDQANHPAVEAYLDAPVTYSLAGDVMPGSGTLQQAGVADQAGATRDEAKACDYVHDDSPPESFWRNMRFDLAFSKAQLGPLVGRRLYVSGAWHAPADYLPRVQEAQLANSPVIVPSLTVDPLTVGCSGAPATVFVGEAVTWTASPGGGTGLYSFAWHDDDGHSDTTGPSAQWQPAPYATSGLKTTEVTVFDNNTPPAMRSATCQLTVILAVNSAVLPGSRSVLVGSPATAFLAAAVVSASQSATGCGIARGTDVPAEFAFQETDPATNVPTGTPNTLFDLAPSTFKTFVVSLTPTAPFEPTEVAFDIVCADGSRSTAMDGINTLTLSGSTTPVPDLLALAATPSNDGILRIKDGSTGAFAIATVNVGAASLFDAVVSDTSGHVPPAQLTVCQTDQRGQCLFPPLPGRVIFSAAQGETPTFSVFVTPNASVPLDLEHNRIFVEFKDVPGVVRGRTSVAVTTVEATTPDLATRMTQPR
jgi:hypothetical protein